VTAALAVSGLPTDRFCFEGFPPRKAGERARRFADLAAERRTMVFFESPRRLATTLAELSDAFGAGRSAAVCRELTKTHEEIVRGSLAELVQWAKADVLGEITLVVAGAPAQVSQMSAEQIRAEITAAQATGSSRSDAVTAVAAKFGLRRRDVYNAAVNLGSGH
jgi:16S rRNA (cytidine1402-2'-O)-methyltransferase